MEIRNLRTVLRLGFWSALTALIQPCFAQAPQMSLAQARQILLSYVKPPDTTFTAVTGERVNVMGHTEYLFRGDGGGKYWIDAVTAEKDIEYAGLSSVAQVSGVPNTTLSEAQIQQSATNFVAQYFPHYVPGMFAIVSNTLDVQNDGDECFVHFCQIASSGAYLPIHCMVCVEEDTGAVTGYSETAIPVTVNTLPAISQDQAVQIGQNWISQNVSADPSAITLRTDTGDNAVALGVFVDPVLNEVLAYRIEYMAAVLMIDAQAGMVLSSEGYLSISLKRTIGPTRDEFEREILLDVRTDRSTLPLDHSVIQTHGHRYIWTGYLKVLGIQTARSGGHVRLKKGDAKVGLPVADKAAGGRNVAWLRKGQMYVPMTVVQTLTSAIHTSPNENVVILSLPKPVPGKR